MLGFASYCPRLNISGSIDTPDFEEDTLFVYSIAQRRLPANLQAQNQTLPNQIDQPTKRPTLRWVFQLFEGIHLITFINKAGTKTLIDRLSDLRKKILRLLGPSVCPIYQISMVGS